MTRPTETDRAKTDRDRGIGSAAWMFAGKSAVDSVSSFAGATEGLLYLGFFSWCVWRFRIGEHVYEDKTGRHLKAADLHIADTIGFGVGPAVSLAIPGSLKDKW